MIDASKMLIALLVGHFLVDFLRAGYAWGNHHTWRISDLLWALAHGLVTAAVIQLSLSHPWSSAVAGLLVSSGHCLVLQLTSSFDERQAFAIGEPLRLLILLGIWWVLVGSGAMGSWRQDIDPYQVLITILAYLLVLKPASSIIRFSLKPWVQQMDSTGDSSLVKAGAMLGYLERILILSFLLMGEYMAIGFVLALKAAYRFHETEETAKAEYILMGTFLSFVITLAIGAGAKYIMVL